MQKFSKLSTNTQALQISTTLYKTPETLTLCKKKSLHVAQFYKTPHNHTTLYNTFAQLYKTCSKCQQFCLTLHKLYETWNNNFTLFNQQTTIHNYSHLYTMWQKFTRLYTTCKTNYTKTVQKQNKRTKLWHNYTQLLQHFTIL